MCRLPSCPDPKPVHVQCFISAKVQMGTHACVIFTERHVTGVRGRGRVEKPAGAWSPRRGSQTAVSHQPSTRSLLFTRRSKNCCKVLQDDGVQLGLDHERGEQHRGSERAHHALLLQTGGPSTTASVGRRAAGAAV